MVRNPVESSESSESPPATAGQSVRAHCVYCAMGGKEGTDTHFQVRLVSICAGLARRGAGCAGGVVGLALVVCLKLGRGRSECSVRTLVGVCRFCSWVASGPLAVCAAHFASSVIVGDPSWELARASG